MLSDTPIPEFSGSWLITAVASLVVEVFFRSNRKAKLIKRHPA